MFDAIFLKIHLGRRDPYTYLPIVKLNKFELGEMPIVAPVSTISFMRSAGRPFIGKKFKPELKMQCLGVRCPQILVSSGVPKVSIRKKVINGQLK